MDKRHIQVVTRVAEKQTSLITFFFLILYFLVYAQAHARM